MPRVLLIHWKVEEAPERVARLRAAGVVDYKICAIDETWSGLRFARRRR
jgi:hypothetical protein